MKKFLYATAAAALFIIPGISAASSLDYEQSGSNYTVLFNPNGSGTDNLPPSFYYRSYDCTIGSKPVVVSDLHITVTPPAPTGNTGTTTITPETPPAGNGGTTPDGGTTPPTYGPTMPKCDPGGYTASVPLPASSEMAGAGLAVIALASWQRSRRLARA